MPEAPVAAPSRPPAPLAAAPRARLRPVRWVLADIDDSLTTDGRLTAAAYAALEALAEAGRRVVPVTGRPAGWCDMIARQWPVAAVVGENGALWYAHDPAARRMRRHHAQEEPARAAARARLTALAERAMAAVPGCAIAADQPFRLFDVAVDFREDAGPLDLAAAGRIAAVFRAGGAEAKVSSIHVNAWIGRWDKLSGLRHLVGSLWGPLDGVLDEVAFVGDSPNDAPQFAALPLSVGVANVRPFLDAMPAAPAYVMRAEAGGDFVEFARRAGREEGNGRGRMKAATIGAAAAALAVLLGPAAPAGAQQGAAAAGACTHRGALDDAYCDEDRDLVADLPRDPARLRDPSTLVFAYTPVEDPALYASQFRPFLDYLTQCTGRRTVYFQVTSNAAQVEAMRSGRLHIAGFSTGPTAFAVNLAGAVPFAVKGGPEAYESYRLVMLVRADSPYRTMADLKGKRVAHTSATSNSGNLAPRALFPAQGLVPDQDYRVVYSGGHDRSVMGVNAGDYDAAPVASDVFNRMAARGQVRRENIRVIWESAPFPTSSFALAHDLRPELAQRIRQCFFDFRFPEAMRRDLGGNDRFWPATYLKDWEPVRQVADAVDAPYTRANFDAEARREEEAAARRAAQRRQQQEQQGSPPAQAPAQGAPARTQ